MAPRVEDYYDYGDPKRADYQRPTVYPWWETAADPLPKTEPECSPVP